MKIPKPPKYLDLIISLVSLALSIVVLIIRFAS